MKDASGKIPYGLYAFFWDVKPEKLNPVTDYVYILERLMEYGDDKAFRWIMNTYDDHQRIEVLKKSRKLSRKTATFWSNYYRVPKEEIRCFSKSFPATGDVFWNN
jgi:hypothetical protein